MEKPSWAPIVFAGALPRELPDLLAIVIVGLASTETVLIQLQFGRAALASVILLLTVAPACTLASLSNSSRRQREELALFAYGGAGWQIHMRYFLRGAVVASAGLLPQMFIAATMTARLEPLLAWSVVPLVITGGAFYAAPSLRRTSSPSFVEHYKG